MRILVSCANGSGTSLMMMRSVEKAMKELNVPITKNVMSVKEISEKFAETKWYQKNK